MAAYIEADNEKARQDALDLLDEERDLAIARSAIYQQDLPVITAAGLGAEPFRKVTWCFGSSRISLICTSYPRLGKGPLWSARICTIGHITSSIFESTKTHLSRKRRPSGRGIQLISVLIILNPPAFKMYIFFDDVYIMIYIINRSLS